MNVDVTSTAGLRSSGLFGHIVRLDTSTPAHQALNRVIRGKSGHRPDVHWRGAPGRPRIKHMDPAD